MTGKTSAMTAAIAALTIMLTPAASALAQQGKSAGDILVRLRGIAVVPDEDSSLSLGGASIPGEAKVDNAYVPELDITYFVTDSIALELILATTQHDVSAKDTPLGNVDLGDVWLLPPTLTLQYHPLPKARFSPYVGAGINYTIFYGEDEGSAQSIDYDNKIGYALQAGFDYEITDRWYLNFDVKKLWLETDVKVDAGLATPVKADVDIDPWIFGLGVGYRF